MDLLGEMQIFSVVAEEGALAAAARRLGCSAPTITRAIASLEQRVGVTLLDRSTQGVRLTDAGERYLSDCQRILKDLDDAEKSASGSHIAIAGHLTISSPILFGQLRMMPLVLAFLNQHPDIRIRAEFIDRTPNQHEEGIDVAVMMGELPDSSLVAIKVGTIRRVVVAAPSYLQQHGRPEHFRDLPSHQLICSTADSRSERWQFQEHGIIHDVAIQARWQTSTNTSAITAAMAGAGITRVMSYQVDTAVAAESLITLLDSHALPPIPVHVVYQEGRRAAARVRSFVDFCVTRLRAQTM